MQKERWSFIILDKFPCLSWEKFSGGFFDDPPISSVPYWLVQWHLIIHRLIYWNSSVKEQHSAWSIHYNLSHFAQRVTECSLTELFCIESMTNYTLNSFCNWIKILFLVRIWFSGVSITMIGWQPPQLLGLDILKGTLWLENGSFHSCPSTCSFTDLFWLQPMTNDMTIHDFFERFCQGFTNTNWDSGSLRTLSFLFSHFNIINLLFIIGI